METITIGQHNNASDGQDGSHYLNREQTNAEKKITSKLAKKQAITKSLTQHSISYLIAHPNTHEAVLESNPWKEENKCLAAAEDGTYIHFGDAAKCQQVQITR